MTLLTDAVKREFLSCCDRITYGQLSLKTPDGALHRFGTTGPVADMDIRDWSVISAMAARGDVGLGETYVAGLWETSSIETLVTVALRNFDTFSDFANPSAFNRFKFLVVDRLLRANSLSGASRNIRAHYDVGNEFYQLWLDPGMTYSSALFAGTETDLERAQAKKNNRVLSRLADGERILEIGCGWGGFAERAADQGHHVTGLTLSPSQKGYADARLDGRADIRLEDYRSIQGTFDNIVSIEMIEAVGERYWPSYFATLKARLAEGGRALVQAITVQDSYFDLYRRGSDYIRQYTFPGGMLLSDAVIADQARTAGLQVRDNFAFGQDYARTCRVWAERLMAQREKVLALGHDQAFLRNWQFYLEICAASFAVGQTDVVQVELAHA
ncbi:cyclopropane-fatty-acyl-phospholipid synthase [Cognatishimia sp. SS12]|uniref:SAM-dependent methyltransferase n=1 Tax=Cognatishimia sp. SS12 TaxID=2979465 RepID=UPI00232C4AE9|nr:cyclopropane-fatty-acyl-phospholipid synthase family protein [Cognatishimia sp. SS12]MDC0739437.1 cyclopropane-fatty-acyl-phospholipid synthase [Cognatishimia sp. SS12]